MCRFMEGLHGRNDVGLPHTAVSYEVYSSALSCYSCGSMILWCSWRAALKEMTETDLNACHGSPPLIFKLKFSFQQNFLFRRNRNNLKSICEQICEKIVALEAVNIIILHIILHGHRLIDWAVIFHRCDFSIIHVFLNCRYWVHHYLAHLGHFHF